MINWPSNMPAPQKRWRVVLSRHNEEDVVLSVQAPDYEGAESRAQGRRFHNYAGYDIESITPLD